MLQRITPQSADRACFLLLGLAGSGKTSQLRCLLGQDYQGGKWQNTTMPPEKVLVLSAESGLLCVRDLVASGAIDGFEIRSLGEFHEALRFCLSDEFLQSDYKWVFIDSLTEISARCVESLKAKYPNNSDSWNLWREYSDTMTRIIKEFRDLRNVNVVFTCLLGIEKDDLGRRNQAPVIQGSSLKNLLTSYFDEVLVMDMVQVQVGGEEGQPGAEAVPMSLARVFRTNFPLGLAKDRSGLLAEVEYPNLLILKNKIIA